MAISKRLRYEVLRRDGHRCHYCGATAAEVKLVVDAVVPEALGGSHKDPSNLITACDPCNNGKTSSSPDAPLVAEVAEDAARWSRAMSVAAEKMRAEIAGRQDVYDEFDRQWDTWSYGFEELPIPRPDDWRRSIDTFLAAGLPVDVLTWCAGQALERPQVKPAGTWRYMCGIAWSKVAELQEAAKSHASQASPGSGENELPPDIQRGRAVLARDLLGDCGSDIDRLLTEAREDWHAETADEQAIAAIHIAWQEKRIGLNWLTFSIAEMFRVLPREVTYDAARIARRELYDKFGTEFSTDQFADRAVQTMTEKYQDAAAATYLAAMPEEERAEWITFANSAFAEGGALSGRLAVLTPAQCARAVKEEGAWYRNMCEARGRHIPRCPSRAEHCVAFAEFECCRESGEDHQHILCGHHLKRALAGDLSTASNGPLAVVDHWDFTAERVASF